MTETKTATIEIHTDRHVLVYTYEETPSPRLPALLATARYTSSVNGRVGDVYEGARALNHWRVTCAAAADHEKRGTARVVRSGAA